MRTLLTTVGVSANNRVGRLVIFLRQEENLVRHDSVANVSLILYLESGIEDNVVAKNWVGIQHDLDVY